MSQELRNSTLQDCPASGTATEYIKSLTDGINRSVWKDLSVSSAWGANQRQDQLWQSSQKVVVLNLTSYINTVFNSVSIKRLWLYTHIKTI